MSTRRRTELLAGIALVLALSACSEEQSKEIGRMPKNTIDKTAVDVDQAMKRGAERLKEDEH